MRTEIENRVLIAYEKDGIRTEELQRMIDACAEAGGGQVRLTAGIYRTATLYLKSGVELYLDAGAVLRGLDDFRAYSNRCPDKHILPEIPEWFDALVSAVGESACGISGEGILDGVDCLNPHGEQGFRGPHGVFFYGCRNIWVRGITVLRCPCYNLMFEKCEDILAEDLKIRGGQDGFRFGDCDNVIVRGCDIRSGDDCIGGSGNRNVQVLDSRLNTPAGSSVMFSCVGFTMKNCLIWSSGVYPAVFRDDKRYSANEHAVMIGYDYGYNGREISDDWLIEDCVFENSRCLLVVGERLHGKTCIPIRHLRFNRIRAVNMVEPLEVIGNSITDLEIANSDLRFIREDQAPVRFMTARHFAGILLRNVRIEGCAEDWLDSDDSGILVQENINLRPASDDDSTPLETLFPRCADGLRSSFYVPKETTEEFRGPIPYVSQEALSRAVRQ